MEDCDVMNRSKLRFVLIINKRAALLGRAALQYGQDVQFGYGLTEIRSLIKSKVSFGTTFFATNSPFTR